MEKHSRLVVVEDGARVLTEGARRAARQLWENYMYRAISPNPFRFRLAPRPARLEAVAQFSLDRADKLRRAKGRPFVRFVSKPSSATVLPETGDRPGSGSIGSVMADVVSWKWRVSDFDNQIRARADGGPLREFG